MTNTSSVCTWNAEELLSLLLRGMCVHCCLSLGIIAVKLWSTREFSCRQSGLIPKGERSWLLVRTLISRLGEEQLCCAGKSCMRIHVLWRQPSLLGASQLPDRNMLRKQLSSPLLSACGQAAGWAPAMLGDTEGKLCLFLLRLGRDDGVAWGPPCRWLVDVFPKQLLGKPLRKLEYETEEMSKRWAKTCNDV